MKRYLDQQIANDLNKKLVILTGPRQVGKTTLSRQLLTDRDSFQYLNWDISGDRRILQEGSWSQQVPLLIFDEIHKLNDKYVDFFLETFPTLSVFREPARDEFKYTDIYQQV